MERVGIRELRQHASRWVDKVKSGESVEVTERGELVAMLVPAQRQQVARDRLVAEGTLLPASNPEGLRNLPAARTPPMSSPSTDDVLNELREDRV